MDYNLPFVPIYDLFEEDPLVNFVCLNPLCMVEFQPKIIMDEKQKKIYFKCPSCETKYEANIIFVDINRDLKVFTIIDGPKVVEFGKKIVSS